MSEIDKLFPPGKAYSMAEIENVLINLEKIARRYEAALREYAKDENWTYFETLPYRASKVVWRKGPGPDLAREALEWEK